MNDRDHNSAPHDRVEPASLPRTPDDVLLRFVNHDLRSPLGMIVGSAELIDRIAPSADIAPHTEGILAGVAHLSMMIDNLVYVADETRDPSPIGPAVAADVNAITNAAAEMVRSSLIGSQATIEVHETTAGPVTIGYPDPLAQLLANLVLNAVRHSAVDLVEVTVESVGDSTLVTIADDGPGPDPSRWGWWSEAGVRDPTAMGTGLGLGLTVALSIAARIAVTIELADRDGRHHVVVKIPSLPFSDPSTIVLMSGSAAVARAVRRQIPASQPLAWASDQPTATRLVDELGAVSITDLGNGELTVGRASASPELIGRYDDDAALARIDRFIEAE